MPATKRLSFAACLFALAAVVGTAAPADAQDDFLKSLQIDLSPGAVGAQDDKVAVTAEFTSGGGEEPARLFITAEMAAGWHIFSITQARGGVIPTKITVDPSEQFELAGEFAAAEPPETHFDEAAFPGLALEEHFGSVTWSAPIEISPDADLSRLEITGKVFAQTCSEQNCLPPKNFGFKARLRPAGTVPAVAAAPSNRQPPASAEGAVADLEPLAIGEYKNPRSGTVIRGRVEPQVAAPGGKAKLILSAEPAETWYVYALAERDPKEVSKPTLIVLTELSGLKAGRPVANAPPVEMPGEMNHYEGSVSWTIELEVPASAEPGERIVAGLIGYQSCFKTTTTAGCDGPEALRFQVTLPVDFNSAAGEQPVMFIEVVPYKDVANLAAGNSAVAAAAGAPAAFDPTKLQPVGGRAADRPLALMMLFAFGGGLILNLMPCVLPVIGLKIVSFVEQSGHSRRHALLLNVWYSLGLLSVFLVLASLPVVYRIVWNKQFGWGQQFAYDGFNITLTAIVFAMALSFLGVWEIPIPGFVGSGKANDLAAKEGFAGAFCKGAITTVLATPCSGPFLGTALAFAVTQPPAVIYLMFASIGLGMASPYLVIGAFPALIHFLPKPGAWMDTFKQTMGFVLLGTVVYLMTFIQWSLLVPTLALLIGLWAGCWWIGRTPLFADFPSKARAWTLGVTFMALVGIVAFQWLGPIMGSRFNRAIEREIAQRLGESEGLAAGGITRASAPAKSDHELPWRPYSVQTLEELTRQQKTVIVDFTADWCATCKTLEATVLNTFETRQFVEANGIVPLVADMTRYPPAESALLEALTGGKMVPVLAIFPAGRPTHPIVLGDAYTRGMLLEKLREAGPSKSAAPSTTTAMN